MTKVKKIICLVAAIVFMTFTTLSPIEHPRKKTYPDQNKYVIPNDAIALHFPNYKDIIKKDVALYSIVDNAEQTIGMVVFSSPISDDIIGFKNHIPMTILMDENQKVVDVIINKNDETPSFMQKLTDARFTDAFIGSTSLEIIDKQIDAVSGATFSSNAITNSIKKRLAFLQEQLHPKPFIDVNLIVAALGLLTIIIVVCTNKKH